MKESTSPTITALTAPTASGKTALALASARAQAEGGHKVELVLADAFTVYRGLDIGTAKPTPDERAEVPHHLLDVADVRENYDVARWLAEAEAAIAEIWGRGNIPLVVGGTGFYLRALAQGLPLAPPADAGARAELEAELETRGLDALLAEIAAVSWDEAARMQRNPRRIVRALEVWRRCGRFPSEFGYSAPKFAVQVVAFSPPMPQLERRIVARTRAMLAAGWAAEAAWLAEQVSPDTHPTPTAWQALGYREAFALARGTLAPAQAEAAITLATRRYAKRQRTFIRTQLGAEVLGAEEAWAALLGSGLHPLPASPLKGEE